MKFGLFEKRKYYRSRTTHRDENKRNYARGFMNGSSENHNCIHNASDKSSKRYWFGILQKATRESERQKAIAELSYLNGCLAGYEAKQKNKKNT